jgi:hypothetical protein
MAIQPIDLQVMFTQLDRIGKDQAVQRDGHAIQQAMQGVQIQKKNEERIRSVNEAQDTGDGAEQVKDRNAARKGDGGEAGGRDGEAAEQEPKTLSKKRFFQDPALGKNLDVSM